MKKHIVTLLIIVTLLFFVVPMAFAEGQQESDEIVLEFPTFWVGEDSKAETVEQLVDEFNEEHEGEIEVRIQPMPDTDGYRSTINTRISAGDPPDVFVFQPDPTTFEFYDAEDTLMDFSDVFEDRWADRFQQSAVDQMTIDGETKSIPYEVGVTPIWYNERLLEEAGLDSFPETFDEAEEAFEALKDSGITPTSQMTGGANAWTSMLWYSHIIGSIGGPDAWEESLDHPQYEQAAEILLELYSDDNTTSDAVGGDADVSGGHYLAERTAIFINGPWYIGRVQEDAPEVYENTRIAPAPAVEGGEHGHQVAFAQSNLAAAHTDDPQRREAVIEFMDWMTRPEHVGMITEDAGSLFSIDYEIDAGDDHLLQQFVEAQSNAAFTIPHFEDEFEVSVVQQFGTAIEEMVLGEATPAEFVEILQDAQD